jgi:hypothetical protein
MEASSDYEDAIIIQGTPLEYRDIGQPIPITQLLKQTMRIRVNCQGYYDGRSARLQTEETVDAIIVSTGSTRMFNLEVRDFDYHMTLRIEGNALVLDVTGSGTQFGQAGGGLFGYMYDPISLIIPPEVVVFRVTQLHSNVISCVNAVDPCAYPSPKAFDFGDW